MTPDERVKWQKPIYDTFDKVDRRIRANDLIKWMAAIYMAQEVQEMNIKSLAQRILKGVYSISEESEALDYIIEYVENCNDEEGKFSLEVLEEKIREEFEGYVFPEPKIKLTPQTVGQRIEGYHILTLEEANHLNGCDWGQEDDEELDFKDHVGKTLKDIASIASTMDPDNKSWNLMFLIRDLYPDKFEVNI